MPSPTLVPLQDRQCRFPVAGEGAATRFCAEEVHADRWYRGLSGDRYCDEHRALCLGGRGVVNLRAFLPRNAPARVRLAGVA